MSPHRQLLLQQLLLLLLLPALLAASTWRAVSAARESGTDGNQLRGQVGSGTGNMREAPAWLQQEAPGLYFPIAHRSRVEPDFPIFRASRGRHLAESQVSWKLTKLENPLSYYTTISLGTGGQVFNVLVDTGSSLLWVQCNCLSCNNDTDSTLPQNPAYNSSLSSTENVLTCAGRDCQTLARYYSNSFGCDIPVPIPEYNFAGVSNYCEYVIQYLDTSYTWGNVFTDSVTVTLTNGSVVMPKVMFGCGRIVSDNFNVGNYAYDGLMGFATGPESVITALASEGLIANSFSICLEGDGTDGHLVLGRTALPSGAAFASVNHSYYWTVDWMSFAIDDSSPYTFESASGIPTIFDTGASTTLLPSTVFQAIYQTVLQQPIQELEDQICYGERGRLTPREIAKRYPSLTLYIRGVDGSSVQMVIPAFNYILTYYNATQDLTFTCPGARSNSSTVIIGATWLRNFDILYQTKDGAKSIGWYPLNCMFPGLNELFVYCAHEEQPRLANVCHILYLLCNIVECVIGLLPTRATLRREICGRGSARISGLLGNVARAGLKVDRGDTLSSEW